MPAKNAKKEKLNFILFRVFRGHKIFSRVFLKKSCELGNFKVKSSFGLSFPDS
jgi:hypothetical protein